MEKVLDFYEGLAARLENVRKNIEGPLTLTAKLLYLHASEQKNGVMQCYVDHVAMHDAAAQIILLQFILSGKKAPAVSASIHCDRLIAAENGAKEDLIRAAIENKEIYDFLESAAVKFGVNFFPPGAGIMLHKLLETCAQPGALYIGTDSYISFLGAMGMLAFEKGGLEILDAMLGFSCEMALPRVVGVHLKGTLKGWASSKDLALKLIPILIAKGARGAVIEYFGEGIDALSCSGRATICSMAAEVDALSAIFPYDIQTDAFLKGVGRGDIAQKAFHASMCLQADSAVLARPDDYYDEVVEFDLSTLEPHVNGPYTSQRTTPLSELGNVVNLQGYPDELSAALIGSSTNSSYEDLHKAAMIARQALKHGLKVKVPFYIAPGTPAIAEMLAQEGLLKVFEDVGATLLASSSGPCVGLWKRSDVAFGERNSILTSYNSNISGFNDSNPNTHAFIASPEVVMALALAGKLSFNPSEDVLLNAHGLPVKLTACEGVFLPLEKAYVEELACSSSPANSFDRPISISSESERLQLLDSFRAFLEKDFTDLRLLVKIAGKCTIDQISPAGKWLKFRGHLDNISNNLFSLSANRYREEIGKGKNLLTGNVEPFSKIARDYKKEDIGWIAVGYDNFGEGPSRDHAAISLRHLGGRVVIANSFAPGFESYLKKQGILTLTFTHPAESEKIKEDDLIDLIGVGQLAQGSQLELLLKHADGTTDRLLLSHSYTEGQLAWFKAGSALNALA